MLRLLGLAAQATLILLAGYNAVTALWGWPDRKKAEHGARQRRFRIVVPAHDEGGVIGPLLQDLNDLDYANELKEVWVVADRCTDDTAQTAAEAGAFVTERWGGTPGKGAALGWYLTEHPLAQDETLVVLDADNRVPAHLLNRVSDEIDAGHQVVQCYLDVTDPDANLLAEASALSYWASNRMVQLARSNLDWSADLGGTGMAVTATALVDAGGFGGSLTEDQELGLRLVLSGHRVAWLHDVRVRDEKPTDAGVAVRQRARWMAGKRQLRRRYLWPLLSRREPATLDMAVRLAQPSRTWVAFVSGILTVAAAVTESPWLMGWRVWGVITAIQVLEPIPFLAKDGVEPRRLLRYPLMTLLAGLWLPVRVISSKVGEWYHTPHRGS